MTIRSVLLFLFFINAASLVAQKPAATIPAFTFFREDQSAFTKENLTKGTKSFFIFFDPGCDHCQRTVAQLDKRVKELLKPSIYFITLDKPQGAKNFMQRYGKNLSQQKNVMMLYDVRYQFIPKFQPLKYPSMFLYNKQGKLLKYSDEEKEVGRLVELASKSE